MLRLIFNILYVVAQFFLQAQICGQVKIQQNCGENENLDHHPKVLLSVSHLECFLSKMMNKDAKTVITAYSKKQKTN